jgi:hypothetical protein
MSSMKPMAFDAEGVLDERLVVGEPMTRRAYGPTYLPNPHDHPIWEELSDELDRAYAKFGPMASPHEGWAVIREELEPELWEHVCGNTGRSPEARHEALQVAAMAIRYILDLCEPARSVLENPGGTE